MAEIIIEAKAMGRLRQEARDLHTRKVKLVLQRGILTAHIKGTDNKGNPSNKVIVIKKLEE